MKNMSSGEIFEKVEMFVDVICGMKEDDMFVCVCEFMNL